MARRQKNYTLFIICIIVFGIGAYRWRETIFSSLHLSKSNEKVQASNQVDKNEKHSNETGINNQYQGEKEIPILMYHYIRQLPNDELGRSLSVDPQSFENQIKAIKDAGYSTITFSDLEENNLPPKPIIITFDDGYADAYDNAYPILKKYNIRGIFYIISDRVGDNEYLSWQQIREMAAGGMIFGSHTKSHPDLPQASSTIVKKELEESKQDIENHINESINDFSYPAGKYNKQVISAVYGAGYKSAVTTHFGPVKKGAKLLELPRLRITDETNINNLLGR